MRSIVLCALASLVLVTSGCAEVVYKDRIVEIPVLVFQQPPAPTKIDKIQELPTDKLGESSSDEETAKAYAETVAILKSYVKQLEAVIEPFRSHSATPVPK
jgi:hypothetical protein